MVATFLYLGWFDGGFLSVSHITAAISVGPSVFLEDIPLLLLVVFTVVTTLLAGRVFCGFLCPFGALQDFLERGRAPALAEGAAAARSTSACGW